MGSRVEDLLSLARMLDEGKVSQEEYEVVKAELLAAPAEEWLDPAAEPPAEGGEPEVPDLDSAEIAVESPEPDLANVIEAWISKAKELPAIYRWGGGALSAVVLGLMLFGGGDSPPVQAADLPQVETAPEEAAALGSLGIRLEEIESAWNDAGIPPSIMGGFARTPESGPLDSFLYRFDDAAIIAGAYEPSHGAVYALMLRVGMMHESRSDLNSHVCHLLHPFDQACLDSLGAQAGLSGEPLAGDHEATWTFQGNTWRLSVSDDVQTLRVIAPGQP